MTGFPLLLVAEDEVLLHAALEDELTEAGFEVVMVTDGNRAISHLQDGSKKFSALVTDIRMGSGPNGWDVAHRARELFPSLPVVYMTGDSAKDWAANGVPNSVVLSKPFAMAQLVVAVSQLITDAENNLGSS